MDNLFNYFLKNSIHKITGWDFSYVTKTGRMVSSPLDWSLATEVIKKIRNTDTFLDMGTGGGEFLSKLRPLPPKTYATEEFNYSIAKRRLEPLGVTVINVTGKSKLDIENEFFDLIMNRHSDYSPEEVRRIVKSGGYFITQQVGGKNCLDLNHIMGFKEKNEFKDWDLDYATTELSESGLKIIQKKENHVPIRFYDIGAIIFYLKAVPWQILDFSISKYKESLYKIHEIIQEKGYIEFMEHRFFILAENS